MHSHKARSGIAGSRSAVLCNSRLFSTLLTPISTCTSSARAFQIFHTLTNTWGPCFLFIHSSGCSVVVVTNEGELLFICLLVIQIPFSGVKCLVKLSFVSLDLMNFFHILNRNPLQNTGITNSFSLSPSPQPQWYHLSHRSILSSLSISSLSALPVLKSLPYSSVRQILFHVF